MLPASEGAVKIEAQPVCSHPGLLPAPLHPRGSPVRLWGQQLRVGQQRHRKQLWRDQERVPRKAAELTASPSGPQVDFGRNRLAGKTLGRRAPDSRPPPASLQPGPRW